MNAADVVVGVVTLNGSELVGRTRLQKTVFLLNCCGAEFDLSFSYHYYGPYSFELKDGWVDAEAEARIVVEEAVGGYGVPYSIFRVESPKTGKSALNTLGKLPQREAKHALKRMDRASNTVLELAATMVYLRKDCPSDKIIEEVKALKPNKATDRLLAEAGQLLDDLGLGA